MLYRRNYNKYRRYGNKKPDNEKNVMKANTFTLNELEKIPLPTEESDIPVANEYTSSGNRLLSSFQFLKGKIHLEEIIILGVIFVLLTESIEDDILLIILVYLLVTGIEHIEA